MNSAPLRIVAAITLAVVVVVGFYVSGKLIRDSRARVDELRETATNSDSEDGDRASTKRALAADEEEFAEGVHVDVRNLGVDGFQYEAFRSPYKYSSEAREAVVLGNGASWASRHMRITAKLEKVTYKQHGATIAARHAIAYAQNISDVPIAYFLRVRSHDRGHCEVRGARMHNAMALMPQEQAEIVVCAGGGKIRVEQLFVLEITELGAYYLSQVPAAAVGHDDVTAGSHRPLKRVAECFGVDDTGVSAMIRAGTTRWVDVVDFFARHNCERHEFYAGYRHAPDGPARLPAIPPG